MSFIVTETHYEYNDETYNSPDAEHGKEPGVPVAIFDNRNDAEKDRWSREIAKWRSMDYIAGYVYEFHEEEYNPGDARYESRNAEIRERKVKYADIIGVDPSTVEFGYEFSMPTGLTDAQIREVIEMFEGPHFYNVFEV